ncbi:dissimilatory sulfite reductase (desulfoviridin), alpha/beta subunit [Desulfosporosinus orientis DSM 765]|uniref:Dissimilatory sulfite reductase (Desulfoviridin), alpha/beta subunit n=1 Tax=Desulfosporosinus orientis (strain ATCC 19365 / DSM 765 / NCIMB 8382 / VKM B-1628 / Singapore I) TaxID=768706 RepID=G7W987_DESOD|nr:4Fe-4S dicluster domain-containing protein [Desulfosporosinus orientis]AET68728.1 dissimilatory sulfite reductase (desulfoviridin), alpha/beta subunit [Desulfosporosinus orientis DSM 765]
MKNLGFKLEHCRPNCPKSVRKWDELYETLNHKLIDLNLYTVQEEKFSPVLHHHLPKIAIAGCPNGCSQPDIKDFSISGYESPRISDNPCLQCGACVKGCLENAITLVPEGVIIHKDRCLACGNCQKVCLSGTIAPGESGWNLRIGGRVGRHPRFATFAGQALTDAEVIAWVTDSLEDYIKQGLPHERLTHFLENRANSIQGLRASCPFVNPSP